VFTAKLTNKESFTKPTEILYADSVKALASPQGIKKMPIQKLESQENITWTETCLLENEKDSPAIMQDIKSMPSIPPQQFQRIVQQIKEYSFKLVLTKMGKYGHGVFSCADIPANTYIASYSGQVMLLDNINESGTYCMRVEGNSIINSRNIGNIGRFFQHLPSASNEADVLAIDEYTFKSPHIQKEIATANIKIQGFNYKNHLFVLTLTTCPIAKGDIIGFDYGSKYWQRIAITPVLFFKNGQVLEQSSYKINHMLIEIKYLDKAVMSTKMSFEEIENLFRIQKEIKLAPDEELILTLSEKDFRRKYNANPRNPIYFFEKPSRVIQSSVVKAELDRISACLQLPAWKYLNSNESAFTESCDKEKVTFLGDYLEKTGCKIQYISKDNNTILIVQEPDPVKLEKITEISIEENNVVPK